jgi:energy-coupling factor transport system ATP-binding protein
VIRAEGLGYLAPGGVPVLREISLAVAPGARIGLVGPSGAGKSTLGYHLCGVHDLALPGRSTGALVLDGRDALRGGLRGFGGLVLQNPESQLFGRTVAEEAGLGPGGSGRDRRLAALLDRLGFAGRHREPTAELSLGWKQRLAIAGMLALEPRVLVLDEPTNYLDGPAADALFQVLGQLPGTTVVVADHDEERLAAWAGRILRLEAGTLAADHPAADHPPAPPLPVRPPAPAPGGLLLALEELEFAYHRGRPVLAGASLELREGEAVALAGPNGCGKSTLLRLAKGLLRPGRGRVRLATGGEPLREVGLVFQNPDDSLFAPTVAEECAFLPANLGLADPAGRARAALERVGLAELAGRAPFSLSFGEKRRATLAAVLAGGVRVLCLDEPTAGLDRANLERLAALLQDHARQGGAVLFATHDRRFAQAVATRTVRLEGGRLAP